MLLSAVVSVLLIVLVWQFAGSRKLLQRELAGQQRQHQKNLHKLQQQLDQANIANLAMTQYLMHTSEQLQHALAVVAGGIRELEENSSPQKLQLHSSSAIAEMQELIDYAQELSIRQSGRLAIFNRPFSLHSLLKKVKNNVSIALVGRQLSYNIKLASNVPDNIVGDQQGLMQVLLNLISHAAESTRHDSVVIMLKQLGRDNNIARVLFSVADKAQGISRDQQMRLFDEFSEFKHVEISEYDLDSPGLAISQKLLMLMGGCLHLEYHEKLGKRFYFTLPLKLSSNLINEHADAGVQARSSDGFPLKDRHVLLAGARQHQLLSLAQWLTNQGASVDSVENGQLAIQALLHSQTIYDVILLEQNMPVMGGVQTAAELRDVLQMTDLPVFGLDYCAMQTAPSGYREAAADAGMNGVFDYPAQQDKLLEALAQARKQSRSF